MKVTIVMKCCKFSMEVGPQEPILEIKKNIQHLHGIPIHSQTPTVCDWELIDGLDLADYPLISDCTNIHLTVATVPPVVSQNPRMKIIVKFSARKIEIETDETDTVCSLKEKIHIVDGTPMRRMTLFFNGTEMEDDFRSLNEFGIHDGSEILAFLKTTGRVAAEPPSKRVAAVVQAAVVQTSSSLMNGARIPVQMKDASRVEELRQLLVERGFCRPMSIYLYISRGLCVTIAACVGMALRRGFLYAFKGSVSRGCNKV